MVVSGSADGFGDAAYVDIPRYSGRSVPEQKIANANKRNPRF